uniref:Uncharacterized protein n=1 Tax=Rhizophora mucronata TaxID=61149 RepID=A0A2P2JZL6_RHIMU
MVQQTVDSKFSEYKLGNGGANLSTHDTQFPIAVKKMALRDVQNEIRSPSSIGNPKLSKDRGTNTDVVMASGAKRPLTEDPVNSSHYQPANAHLVYVRRKPEAEISKSNASDSRMINSDCSNSRQPGQQASQSQQQMKEPKVPSLLAFPSVPVASSVSKSGKPSVSFSPGQSNPRFSSLESNKHPVASAVPLANNLKGIQKMQWEERYYQLQSLLKQLDESDQEDYIQSKNAIF